MKLLKTLIFSILLIASFPAFSVNYFVDCNASTGGDGSSGTPWDTVSDVNGATFTTGDDVYFKVGCSWSETLWIDWSGNSGDYATIGSYYATNTVGVGGFEKPILRGNISSIDDEPLIDTGAGIPTSEYDGMVNIGSTATGGYQAYVIVENFQILDSGGRGIVAWHKKPSTAALNTNNIIRNNFIKHSMSAAIAVAGQNHHIFNNRVEQAGLFSFYSSRKTDGQPCIYVKSNTTIVESNHVQECWFEGIGTYQNSGYTIIVDNVVVAVRRVGVYVSESSNGIIERNKIIGDRITRTVGTGTLTNINWFYSNGYPGEGMRVTTEEFANLASLNVYFRNNLVANSGGCVYASVNTLASSNGGTAEAFFYGNTCAGNRAIAPISSSTSDTMMTVKNNVFFDSSSDGTSTDCKSRSANVWDYNYWETAPTDVDCRGANDLYGSASMLTLNRSSWPSTIGLDDIPSDSDFRLNNTIVDNAGDNLNTSVFSTASFPICGQLAGGCASIDLLELGEDFGQLSRDSTPDLGAINHASAPSAETIPYYQNTGGALYAGTVTYKAEAYVTSTGTLNTDTTANAISGTTDDTVYQVVRLASSGDTLTAAIPIANGTYDVTIGYVTYTTLTGGATCNSSQGPNVFDLSIEGQSKENEFNVCMNTGGVDTAFEKKYGSITVSDQTMTIVLSPGSTGVDNRPFIASIKVTALAINIGTTPVSLTLSNEYSNANAIDAVSLCNVTGIGTITITGVTQPTTGTIAIVSGALSLTYLPPNATTSGSVGSTTVTFSDGTSTDTCVINLTVTITGVQVRFRVYGLNQNGARRAAASTTGWNYWLLDTTNNTYIEGENETTDTTGVMSIFCPSCSTSKTYQVVIRNASNVTIGTNTARLRVFTIKKRATN